MFAVVTPQHIHAKTLVFRNILFVCLWNAATATPPHLVPHKQQHSETQQLLQPRLNNLHHDDASGAATKVNSLPRLMLITVASDDNDALRRLRRSAKEFGLELHVFGMDAKYPNHSQKIRVLQAELAPYRERDDLLILFVDGYDVMLNAGENEIVQRFLTHFPDRRLVFGVEPECFPPEPADLFPLVQHGDRFLNSGLYIGYASSVVEFLTLAIKLADESHDADDQRVFSYLYVNDELRERQLLMGLDHTTNLFLNLHKVAHEVELVWSKTDGFAQVHNRRFGTFPVVIHGNGRGRFSLNSLGNYIAHEYNMKTMRCRTCDDENGGEGAGVAVAPSPDAQQPLLVLALFVTKQVADVGRFLELVGEQNFPKTRIHLLVFVREFDDGENAASVRRFMRRHGAEYASASTHAAAGDGEKANDDAKLAAIRRSVELSADFLCLLSVDAHLSNPSALRVLVKRALRTKSGIIAPLLLASPSSSSSSSSLDLPRSNFWGDIVWTRKKLPHKYVQNWDYEAIVRGHRRGTWNVPYVRGALLVAADRFARLTEAISNYKHKYHCSDEEDDTNINAYRKSHVWMF